MSHRNKGSFVALDARTGAALWATPGRAGDNAAMLVAGETLFALTTDAELIVSKATRTGFDERRRYTVAASPTWAHPVVTRAGILVKDAETLALWRIEPSRTIVRTGGNNWGVSSRTEKIHAIQALAARCPRVVRRAGPSPA